MAKRLYRFLCLAGIAFWMGGFTFYALVVFPTGNHLLGSIGKGWGPKRVTQWRNVLGGMSMGILVRGVRRSRLLAASWLVMAAALIALYALHRRLDVLIDGSLREVSDETRFYRWHQAYLVAVTIQWSAAVIHLWGLVAAPLDE